jgi:hypothetical protein
MEKQFITEEEKSELTSLRQKEEQLIISLGQIEYQIQALNLSKDNLKREMVILRNDQTELGKSLTEKYGDGDIDMETGEFKKA